MKNREIKFRVYDKKEKRFLFGDVMGVFDVGCDYDNIFKLKSGLVVNKKIGYKWGFLEFCNHPDLVIQQCTELKDQNGKEIYEGDIVIVLDCDAKEVIFDEGQFQLSTGEILSWPHVINNVIIIGNIFENLKLLK